VHKYYLVIPVYNEGLYLPKFLVSLEKNINKLPQISKIIFVNDGSTDNSQMLLADFRNRTDKVILLTHKTNQGKGKAMHTGYELAKKKRAAAVIFMDADLQHDPKFLAQFVSLLSSEQAVFGYRILGKKTPFFRKLGNSLAKYLLKLLFKIKRKDVLCGFFAIRQELFSIINWQSLDYGVETEITIILAKRKIDFTEVKISTVYHLANKGVSLFDAFLILLGIPYLYYRSEK